MKIMAPGSNFESCKMQIDAGAHEIYLCGETDTFKNFTFHGRGKYNVYGEVISQDANELKRTVEYAHERGVDVLYTANLPYLANSVEDDYFQRMFIKYIEQGIDAGVDYLIIGDIGAILLLNDLGVKVPIIASTFFETINVPQIDFLVSLGVKRVVLSYHVTLKEIEEVMKSVDKSIKIEIFGQYGCSFFENCNFKHSFGESSEMGVGVPCLGSYNINFENKICSGPVLNASLNCSLCSLPYLYDMGVYSIKLVGRSKNTKMNIVITEIYSKLIKFIKANKGNLNYEEYLELKDQIIPDWWRTNWCKTKSCKYQLNKVTKTYVGN